MAKKLETLSTLNGLRGVAAIFVVLLHREDWFGRTYPFHNAFLAVDFFFVLSGFVISRAYEDKLKNGMSFVDFVSRRVQRLFPLIFLGVGTAVAISAIKLNMGQAHIDKIFVMTAMAGLFTVPAIWLPEAWSFDPPTWSLFWELSINIVFGLVAARLTGLSLAVGIVVSGLVFIVVSPSIYSGRPDATFDLAWGLPRVTFLFYLGVGIEKIHNVGVFRRFRLNFTAASLLLIGTFTLSDTWGVTSSIACVFVVSVLYPTIVIGAANTQPSGANE